MERYRYLTVAVYVIVTILIFAALSFAATKSLL